VYAYAKTLAQTADAEDLTHEAFLEVHKQPPDPSLSRARREARVFGIVKNKHRHQLRHEAVALNNEAEVGREMDDNRSRVGDPEFDSDMRQLRGLLFAAMGDLNAYYEQVVLMRFFENMEPAEIAAELGKPAKRIHNALTRALKQLRKHDELRDFLDHLEIT
jgi:RNA polymerase sigma factor (sigma-70 family)